MVNKGERPTEVVLARGPVLPDELTALLKTAAAESRWPRITFYWRDGHEASVYNTDDLDEPVENADGLNLLSAHFTYSDQSTLAIWLNPSNTSKLTATGRIARQRQSTLSQQWAALPGRGRLNKRVGFWLSNISLSLAWSIILTFGVSVLVGGPPSPVGWAFFASAVLIAGSLHLYIRRLTGFRWIPRLVVLQRAPISRTNSWDVVSALGAAAGVVIALGAWLFPRA